MNPGRELDALVAERVMGWARITNDFWGCPVPDKASMVPIHKYSTDIVAAWDVIEKLQSMDTSVENFSLELITSREGSQAALVKWGTWADGTYRLLESYDARGETAPHAICLAALKASNK